MSQQRRYYDQEAEPAHVVAFRALSVFFLLALLVISGAIGGYLYAENLFVRPPNGRLLRAAWDAGHLDGFATCGGYSPDLSSEFSPWALADPYESGYAQGKADCQMTGASSAG